MVIKLQGGPLDGELHKVKSGFPVPDSMGLPIEEGKKEAWYHVLGEEAFFSGKIEDVKPLV